MFCWKCGKEIIEGASFCSYCGESSQGFAYVTARMTGLTSASRVQELQRYDMIPTGSAFDAPMKAYDLMESYWANGWESASSEDYDIIRDIEAGRA